MNFKDFIAAYGDGSITKDATWRAYGIDAMVRPSSIREAMKSLGYRDFSYTGLSQLARDYGLANAPYAANILGLWWTWKRIASGEVKRRLIKRENDNDG